VAAFEARTSEPGRRSSSAALAAALVAAPAPALAPSAVASANSALALPEGRPSLLPLAEEGAEGEDSKAVPKEDALAASSPDLAEVAAAAPATLPPVAEEGDNGDLLGSETGGPIERLLRECGQSPTLDAVPSLGDFISDYVDLQDAAKIGEGTFGEAFIGGGRDYKVIPIEGTLLVNGEVQKTADEVRAESVIANRLTQMSRDACPDTGVPTANKTPGFIRMHGMGTCRGSYPDELVSQWEAWDEAHGSENDHVGAFSEEQLYIVFVFENGGRDLERFQLHNFDEVRSLLLQTILTLAVGEEACGFEHRDLHWGNVLLDRCPGEGESCFRLRGVDVRVQTAGLKVSLIDFTLSRLQAGSGEIAFCDLSADPELFQGPKGDVQADTYRRMRQATRGDWQEHRPKTNALWLHYLADILLNQKQWGGTMDELRRLKRFRRAAMGYASAAEAVWDELFEDLWVSGEEAA
jgi:serine/threonine-protein kinase haspin